MKKIQWLSGLAVGLVVAACGNSGITGALEEGELYNTLGLSAEESLFNANGFAEVAWAPVPFVRAGLMWDADEGCQLEARIMDKSGIWSEWKPLRPTWSEGVAHTGYVELGTEGVAFQLRHVAGPEPLYLMAEAIGQVGEVAEPDGESPDGLATLGQPLAPSSLVHPRSDWGARAPKCSSASHSPAKITVHHTATPLPDSLSPAARLRQIQSYHMDSNGWCDIGYHFLTDRNGALWQGRNETVVGAHVANNNTNNVGISFIGTYNSASPTSSQLSNTASLMAWLHDRYGIPMNRTYVKGHREYRGNAAGDCPGDKLYAKLGDLCSMAAGGGGGGGGTNGKLQGVVFEDVGVGTADMSRRLYGATVKLNTGASATADADEAYWSFSVPAGSYTVTASKSGYQTASKTCSVTSGGETWCSIGLVKIANVPKGVIQGVVFIDVGSGTSDMSRRLPGATVKLSNGQSTTARAGDAFWSMEAPAGTYTVTASMSGYQSASRSCTINANGETWCSIGLSATSRDSGGGSGEDPGGGDDPSGGDDPGQGDPSQGEPGGSIEGKGRVFGRVVDAGTVTDSKDVSSAKGVGGASILVDNRFTIVADGGGFFEVWVDAGEITLLASADGYFQGGNDCLVVEGGSVECNIFMAPTGNQEQPPDEQQPEDIDIYGCSCSHSGSGVPAGALWLVALGLLLRRRR